MNNNKNLRILILDILMTIIGVIFIGQLFNLQIIKGEEYRGESDRRIIKQTQSAAPRGEVLDRYGNILATNREGFNILFYKVKMTEKERNQVILKLTDILERKGAIYRDTFPVTLNPTGFEFVSATAEEKWKKDNKFNANVTPEEAIEAYADKYQIAESYTIKEKRAIIGIRYELQQNGYTAFKAYEIATDVSKEVIAEVSERESELPGVSIEVQPIRNYPNGSLASHIIGYIGKINQEKYEELKNDGYSINENIGKDGIESVMEKYLKGANSIQGATGVSQINGYGTAGAQVYLTIDSKLQEVTEKSLEENIKAISTGSYRDGSADASSGAVIAIDVNTGEILAMASYPDYDPNLFVKGISNADWKNLNNDDKPMFNRNISGLYSPGSIYKMVVASAALETEVIDKDTKIEDKGVYEKYKYPQPKCWIWTPSSRRTHGVITVSDAIKYSCNYFFYTVSEMVGIEKIEEYARMYGLNEKTGIELPGEKTGIIAGKTYVSKEKDGVWMPGDTLSAAIGQSYNSFTPIEIARYIAILANGGERVTPHIIKNIIKNDGTEVDRAEIDTYLEEQLGTKKDTTLPDKINFKGSTLEEIYKGMESVTGDSEGTAYSMFRDFPIKVAGKTGTVQVANKDDNAWFLGFAPYDNPEIAICAVIEQGAHGSYTAPIIRDILEEYFVLKQTAQDVDTKFELNNNQMR